VYINIQPFDNRFDNRLYRVYSRLSKRLSNRLYNRFDNRLYPVNRVSEFNLQKISFWERDSSRKSTTGAFPWSQQPGDFRHPDPLTNPLSKFWIQLPVFHGVEGGLKGHLLTDEHLSSDVRQHDVTESRDERQVLLLHAAIYQRTLHQTLGSKRHLTRRTLKYKNYKRKNRVDNMP